MIPSTSFARYESQALGVLRIVTALLFIGHAMVKLFGFPPGAAPGPQALTSLFGVAGVIELIVGVMILIGWFTRPAAFLAAGEMAVGYWMIHAPQSPFPIANKGELAILFCFMFLYLMFSGPGAWSVDGRGRHAGRGSGDGA